MLLKDLYVDELKDLYNAENQLVKALPKMAREIGRPPPPKHLVFVLIATTI
ncbi:MAG: DUF892 family protein, partial [Verrucomicrobiota bacterium]|nr:DUF892 family protein [Verrucomicrobiota bacterium]